MRIVRRGRALRLVTTGYRIVEVIDRWQSAMRPRKQLGLRCHDHRDSTYEAIDGFSTHILNEEIVMKSDLQLQQDIYEELKWSPDVTPTDIGVSVSNGVVTLNGVVPNYAEKRAAEVAVGRVSGVKAVAEELKVKHIGSLTDTDIAKAATHVLGWHVWVPEDINVTVENGWLTLTGEVDRVFQKAAAENAVKYLRGVMGITNHITVKPSVTRAEIKQDIKRALRRHGCNEAQNVVVNVYDGTVSLSGSVRSWLERCEAEEAAWATPGVIKVENVINVAAA